MDATTLLSSQLTAAAACAYLLNMLQRWEKLPWITANTQTINAIVRAAMAGGTALGIQHVWNPAVGGGGVLTITIPSAAILVHGAWHWFGQYAFTHIAGKVLNGTQTAPAGGGSK